MRGDKSESDDFLVKYKGEIFDLNRFIHKHPGGVGTLSGLRNRDLTKIMSKDPVHSEAAFYLMKEYKVRKDVNNNNCQQVNVKVGRKRQEIRYAMRNGHSQDKHTGAINGLLTTDKDYEFYDKAGTPVTAAGDSVDCDDRLEHLVDWGKAMLPQIPALGDKYHEWVNSPVDRELRLFSPWYLECLTKTPWWLVPLFWIPCISYIVVSECLHNDSLKNQIFSVVLMNYFGGILVWSLLEYTLHRYVFHMDTRNVGGFAKIFHFVLHGLHHKVPTDPNRLVFPPFPAVLIATTIYQMCFYLFNYPRLVLAGGLSGYLIYDMIHYYLHYGSPSTKGSFNKYLYHIKRYHYQHHFVHHDKGFGISSPLWDYVFKSDIVLRKLKFTLKW